MSVQSRGTKMAQSLSVLREDPLLPIIKSVVSRFKPESTIVVGSSSRVPGYLNSNEDIVKTAMIIDFEKDRFNSNVSNLDNHSEFYTKLFNVNSDGVIDGEEGLSISDLYRRVQNFFKHSELTVVNHEDRSVSLGAFYFFNGMSDIIIAKGSYFNSINDSVYNKYKINMRYIEDEYFIYVKKHLSVDFNSVQEYVSNEIKNYFDESGIAPSFSVSEV